jgi:hypothetical protein
LVTKHRQEQVSIHMASGTGMDISHIGHTIVHTPNRPILLKNILYVPITQKNLISIHCLTHDNSIFVDQGLENQDGSA